jgi:gamma-glutamylcyclotransferase (GGCT)/AIG2-like uncharacterized protein YtfP
MQPGEKVFVYGTLKTGHGNNSLLQGRADFIDDDRIEGSLYNLGSYPGYRREGTDMVVGEVWEIADKKLPTMLDNLEGYPNYYSRVKVTTEKGYNCWVYVIEKLDDIDCKIDEGVW